MSVFLRWGIFGILSVAALVYAYNASKDLASRRAPPKAVIAPAGVAPHAEPAAPPMPVDSACEVEVAVAQRAIEARDAKEPLDRLLRIREIGFEEDTLRRERLTAVAKRWFAHAEAIGPFSVRRIAAAECASARHPNP